MDPLKTIRKVYVYTIAQCCWGWAIMCASICNIHTVTKSCFDTQSSCNGKHASLFQIGLSQHRRPVLHPSFNVPWTWQCKLLLQTSAMTQCYVNEVILAFLSSVSNCQHVRFRGTLCMACMTWLWGEGIRTLDGTTWWDVDGIRTVDSTTW